MNYLKSLAKEHPVTAYYLVTFFISWGGVLLLLGGPGQISSEPIKVPFLTLYLITVAGPFIAGILMTGVCNGVKGYRELFSRLVKGRVQIKWCAIALLTAPLTVFTTLFALWLFSPVFLPGIFSGGDNFVTTAFGLAGSTKISFLLFVLTIGLSNGFVEELGWTGFVTHNLRLNHGLIANGLNLGFAWGLWHLLSNYVGSAAGAGTVLLPFYVAVLLFSFLLPFRVLMVWVYEHTGSLLIAVLMHASLDVFWMLSMPNALTGEQRVVWYLAWGFVLWIVVAAVALGNRGVPVNSSDENERSP